jgi:hypothetical protein
MAGAARLHAAGDLARTARAPARDRDVRSGGAMIRALLDFVLAGVVLSVLALLAALWAA